MATKNIVPRDNNGDGQIGTISKVWGHSYFMGSSLADPDVNHGCTNVAETTVYGHLGTIHGTQGGLYINGISDQESASARSLALRGICNDTHTDTVPTVEIIGAKRSGVTVQALAAAETVLQVANHTTVLATVLGDGKVGIGTTSPSSTLELESSTGDLIFEMDNNASNSSNFQIQNGAGNVRADFVLDNNTHITLKGQRVGILDTDPSYTLDVNGTGQITSNLIVGGDLTVEGGDITGPTDGDFRITSDGSMAFRIDADNDETSQTFEWINNTGTQIAALTESGGLQVDGSITASGGSYIGLNYRTIYVDAGSMVPQVTNGAQAGTEELATNDVMVDYFAFDKSTAEYVQFKLVMPEQWNGGAIRAKFYYYTSVTSGDVNWKITANTFAEGDALDDAFGATVGSNGCHEVDDSAISAAGDLIVSGKTGDFTPDGSPGEGDLVIFRVSREPSQESSSANADLKLIGVNIQYREQATASAAW
tara:strand:+ start:1498 stop:2940 length:1443 start_codon:yes stop_codon:yes gene_type:complete